MSELVGVIPAAGRGLRAYPYTATIPKSMLPVDGVPLIERNVALLRDALGVREVRVVVGHHADVIRSHLGDGARLGVHIVYVANDRLDLELPYSIYLGSRGLDRPCCVLLADELYVGSRHADLRALADGPWQVVCGMVDADTPRAVHKNYLLRVADGRITGLEEKPALVAGTRMGTGTYLLQPAIVERLAVAFAGNAEAAPRDWTTWLNDLCQAGVPMAPLMLGGSYVNVNSRDDIYQANRLVRGADFGRRLASLVYFVDDPAEAGAGPIRRFAACDEIDEVLVVARTDHPAFAECAGVAKVRFCLATSAAEPIGTLLRRGLDQVRGEIILLTAGDDTFEPHDIAKLLVYLRDADVVVGTRTTRQMIEQGANMRGAVRVANVFLAKLAEIVWWRFEARFTDLCCLYRGFWRSSYRMIRANLVADGVEAFPELLLEALRARQRIIEIPVHYYNRDLGSPYVRSRYQRLGTFWAILRLILSKRWKDLWIRAS